MHHALCWQLGVLNVTHRKGRLENRWGSCSTAAFGHFRARSRATDTRVGAPSRRTAPRPQPTARNRNEEVSEPPRACEPQPSLAAPRTARHATVGARAEVVDYRQDGAPCASRRRGAGRAAACALTLAGGHACWGTKIGKVTYACASGRWRRAKSARKALSRAVQRAPTLALPLPTQMQWRARQKQCERNECRGKMDLDPNCVPMCVSKKCWESIYGTEPVLNLAAAQKISLIGRLARVCLAAAFSYYACFLCERALGRLTQFPAA